MFRDFGRIRLELALSNSGGDAVDLSVPNWT